VIENAEDIGTQVEIGNITTNVETGTATCSTTTPNCAGRMVAHAVTGSSINYAIPPYAATGTYFSGSAIDENYSIFVSANTPNVTSFASTFSLWRGLFFLK
jgi:hypothetical protein